MRKKLLTPYKVLDWNKRRVIFIKPQNSCYMTNYNNNDDSNYD